MAFMSSMNSLWAGGWKRRFNFEAMRYSRNEMGSSCGAFIEREKCRAGVRSARASVAIGTRVGAALLRSARQKGWMARRSVPSAAEQMLYATLTTVCRARCVYQGYWGAAWTDEALGWPEASP